jgi:hypothetical protein
MKWDILHSIILSIRTNFKEMPLESLNNLILKAFDMVKKNFNSTCSQL